MTIYHPHSGLPPTIEHFEDYGRDEDAIRTILVDRDPTSKFGSLAEFEFAELVLQASLNRKTIDRLLTIVLAIRDGAEFSFRKHTDIEAAWDTASRWHAPVRYCTHIYCISHSYIDIDSLKSILLPRHTRMKSSSSLFGLETYGGGLWMLLQIQIWLNILNGMLAVWLNGMARLGYRIYMSRGQLIGGGRNRYEHVILCDINVFLSVLVFYPVRRQTSLLCTLCGQDKAFLYGT